MQLQLDLISELQVRLNWSNEYRLAAVGCQELIIHDTFTLGAQHLVNEFVSVICIFSYTVYIPTPHELITRAVPTIHIALNSSIYGFIYFISFKITRHVSSNRILIIQLDPPYSNRPKSCSLDQKPNFTSKHSFHHNSSLHLINH